MRIAVIGAGVNGLCSGIRLRERGHDVTIHAERVSPDTTSDRAGAVFSPFGASGEARLDVWIETSRRTLEEIARREPASGVRLDFIREYLSGTGARSVELYGSLRAARRLPPRSAYPHVFELELPHMDVPRYLPYLRQRFEALGGRIDLHRVTDLAVLRASGGYDGLVNCAGLGARELARDPLFRPMRGQVLHVPNELALTTSLVAEEPDGAITYVLAFPRHVVLGGTYERDEEAPETDEVTLSAIVRRCRALLALDGHPRAEEIGRERLRALAGIRPVRTRNGHDEEIRLEREPLPGGGWVVHNYGHGRAGFTLAWGCAEDVVRLIEGSDR